MAMAALTRQQFDSYDPAREALATIMFQERAWYAARDGKLLGILIFDKTDSDWGFVILGPDPKGNMRCIETGVSLPYESEAKMQLVAKMAEFEASPKTVWVQD